MTFPDRARPGRAPAHVSVARRRGVVAASLAVVALVLALLARTQVGERPIESSRPTPTPSSVMQPAANDARSSDARSSDARPRERHLDGRATDPGPTTTIVVLEVAPGGVTLVASVDKPFRHEALPGSGDPSQGTRWRLEDPVTGRLLAEGALALPRLCSCAIGHDHFHGCVVVPHEAVVRVHLPRLARSERLTLRDDGHPLASFLLEDPS